ncbi:MAG: histidine triad nucleotide-binding protein [Alicyclobacillaceae bacterium]|nr:histidine triad nucleotide-binding protein [Alicyclobacillaceae bacterium]
MAQGCIFCRIVEGESPARKVYEDEAVVAFHDIAPQAPVHVLVIPRKHIPSVLELEESDAPLVWAIHRAIREVAQRTGIAESGLRVVTNCGKDGHQTVFHLHYHVLGGRGLGWPPG